MKSISPGRTQAPKNTGRRQGVKADGRVFKALPELPQPAIDLERAKNRAMGFISMLAARVRKDIEDRGGIFSGAEAAGLVELECDVLRGLEDACHASIDERNALKARLGLATHSQDAVELQARLRFLGEVFPSRSNEEMETR